MACTSVRQMQKFWNSAIIGENITYVLIQFYFQVLTGLDLAIPLMCKGEVSTLSVAPRFGYGKKGLPPLVPPNAHLLYTVEVVDFSSEKDLEELTLTKRRGIGIKKRERGNWWYGRGEITLAIQCYRRALEFLDEDQGGIVYPKTDDPDEKVI